MDQGKAFERPELQRQVDQASDGAWRTRAVMTWPACILRIGFIFNSATENDQVGAAAEGIPGCRRQRRSVRPASASTEVTIASSDARRRPDTACSTGIGAGRDLPPSSRTGRP
jgi:hypothetical protein